MSNRVQYIANLIREYRTADRDALLCAIISRWPDISGDELQDAINASRSRSVLVLARPQVEQEGEQEGEQ